MDACHRCGGVCLLVGVLCENCIVDASICMMPLAFCLWCCVCDVIFSCVFILSSSLVATAYGLCDLCWLCGLCVVVGVFVF